MAGKNIFLIHTEPFHSRIFEPLKERGINVRYICSVPAYLETYRRVMPDVVCHSIWDAMAGRPAAEFRDDPKATLPPDAEMLNQLIPHELVAIQMLDRLNFGQARVQDLRQFYHCYLSYWSCVFDRMRPDAVVIQTAPHMGFDYVLYALCKHLSIRTLIIERTYLPDRMIILDQLDRMPEPPDETFAEVQNIPQGTRGSIPLEVPEAINAARNYYAASNLKKCRLETVSSTHRPARAAHATKRTLRYLVRAGKLIGRWTEDAIMDSAYALEPSPPNQITHLSRLYRAERARDQMRYLYESCCRPPDFSRPYIYFALHCQPERTSIPLGHAYANQLLALQTLVSSLPAGWMLYVKEHPRQLNRAILKFPIGRTRAFYETLIGLDEEKVSLIRPTEPPAPLIKNARCVATLSGTSAWEGVQMGVPGIVFGTPWYMGCPGVERIGSVAACSEILNRIHSNEYKVEPAKVQAYTDWLATKATFHGFICRNDGSPMTDERNAQSYASAIAARLATADLGIAYRDAS